VVFSARDRLKVRLYDCGDNWPARAHLFHRDRGVRHISHHNAGVFVKGLALGRVARSDFYIFD
jgi:hypothetical protein